MIVNKTIKYLSSFAIFLLICMPLRAEEKFNIEVFLKWEEVSRRSFIQTSITTAATIAVENSKSHSECIDDWYVSDRRGKEQFLYETMAKYPEHHPIGVIVAVLEAQCGSFNYIGQG